MKEITIFTDGACHGNPGPGGWAAVLQYGEHRKELSGADPATTNNRMELQAAIESLRALKSACKVELHTDSEYLKNGIERWVKNWKRNGWVTQERRTVKNADLWKELDELVSKHSVTWRWVKGHAGQAENERCDDLAGLAVEKLKEESSPQQLKAALTEFRERGRPQSEFKL